MGRILDEKELIAGSILVANRPAFDRLVEILVNQETVQGDELARELREITRYTKPVKNGHGAPLPPPPVSRSPKPSTAP